MRMFDPVLWRFIGVGMVNTLLGLGVIFAARPFVGDFWVSRPFSKCIFLAGVKLYFLRLDFLRCVDMSLVLLRCLVFLRSSS